VVENNYKDPTIRKYLEKYGYELIKRIEIDDVYVMRTLSHNKKRNKRRYSTLYADQIYNN
jgi:hypothetical protein